MAVAKERDQGRRHIVFREGRPDQPLERFSGLGSSAAPPLSAQDFLASGQPAGAGLVSAGSSCGWRAGMPKAQRSLRYSFGENRNFGDRLGFFAGESPYLW